MSLNSLSSTIDSSDISSLAVNPDAGAFDSQLRDAALRNDGTSLDAIPDDGTLYATDQTETPGLNAKLKIDWEGNLETITTLVYPSGDGGTITVLKDAAPKLFALLKEYVKNQQPHEATDKPGQGMSKEDKAKVELEEKKQAAIDKATSDGGRELAAPELYVGENDIKIIGRPSDGLVEFETGDKKYIVDQSTNPQLYDRVIAQSLDLVASDVSEAREKHGLGPRDDLDILSQKTSQKADSDSSSSENLTVSEAATANLLDKYTKGIADGSIGKDDDRARLIMAMEAQAAIHNGKGLTGLQQKDDLIFGPFFDIDGHQTQLTAADQQDIIDGNKVDAALSELFQNEDIAKDYKQYLTDAISTVPDRDGLVERLEQQVGSPEYLDFLADLKADGQSLAAQQDVSTLLGSLNLLDPEKAKVATQNLAVDGITAELDALVGDPSRVSSDNKELALKDVFGLFKSLIKQDLIDIPKRAQDTLDQFIREFVNDKAKASEVVAALDEFKSNGITISDADIKAAMEKTYVPIADRAKMGDAFSALNSKGILGSMSGTVALFSGVYQLVGQGGKLSDDPLERASIAKDFITFASTSSQFVKTGIFDSLAKTGAFELLGLDKTLPGIWGKEGPLGKETLKIRPISTSANSVSTEFGREMGTAIDNVFKDNVPPLEALTPVNNSMYDGIADMFERAAKPVPSVLHQVVGSALKVVGAVTDFAGGVLDIVLGAFTIKSGIENDSDLEKAAGSLQVIGGATGVAAGGIGIAGLLGLTAAAAFVGPLFLVGAVLGAIGGIIGIFVGNEHRKKVVKAEGDWYSDLDNAGLLQPDWGDKLEYARYSFNEYEQRDSPDDQSIFDYQEKEWTYFKETPKDDGSSHYRLDHELHVDYEGDGDNRQTQKDKEGRIWHPIV